jgi:hypothetical protein
LLYNQGRNFLEMTANARRKILLLLLMSVGLTAVIAAGLPRLELKPGLPFPSAANGNGGGGALAPVNEAASGTLPAVYLVGVLLGLFILYLVYQLLHGTPWRELLQPAVFLVLLGVAIAGLLFSLLVASSQRGLGSDEAYLPAPVAPMLTSPLGAPPPGLAWLIWGGLVLLTALLAAAVARRTRRPPQPDRLAQEAEQALQALRDGLDLKSVIIRCYRQMSLALQQEQGLARDEAMTAREFERLLTRRGVPAEPVQQLTRLFEAVRYGQAPPSPADEQQAIECLTTILEYSRERAQEAALDESVRPYKQEMPPWGGWG